MRRRDHDGDAVGAEVTLLCCCFSSLSLAPSNSCWIFWTCLSIFRMVECRISQVKSLHEDKSFILQRQAERENNVFAKNQFLMSWEKNVHVKKCLLMLNVLIAHIPPGELVSHILREKPVSDSSAVHDLRPNHFVHQH